ncbi:E3 ubiquitin-protein ligase PDZRN3-like [Brienomyrus brachyistius]|uniref:E3 ubiquitin-protein ligase PDZRN3-like n=1 Tax=Brienomyrus brachyistius TaxID=42636 RepID=UPI0020B3CF7A|nr:E3 ubiquitin-protein ligase PDZRN3-like [Brienomyrus brachyistius]
MGCRLSGLWFGDGMGVNGRDLPQVSQWEALRILGAYGQPVALQTEGQRDMSDISTQTERPREALRSRGINRGPTSKPHTCTDRSHCSHMTPSGEPYLPTISQEMEAVDRLAYRLQDPNATNTASKRHSCLIGCCTANLEEPTPFRSQTEEPPFAPQLLLHELDSGLGCTDGSFHQGELSGVETEEEEGAVEECTSRGGSSSSESFISSELSDSGFYSVGPGEFRRFQRLLEKKIRLYRSRMAPHGKPGSRERRASQRNRRELESIPEALTFQPVEAYPPPGLSYRCTAEGPLAQGRSSESPRHSPRMDSLHYPVAAPPVCRTACQQRVLLHPHASRGVLRRSCTLHRCPPQVMDRRRASHPTSASYCSATVRPSLRFSTDLSQETDLDHRVSPQRDEVRRGYLPGGGYCGITAPQPSGTEAPASTWARAREDQRQDHWFHTLGHSQDIHDTWPKSAGRGSLRPGLYSTLDSHAPGMPRAAPTNPRAQRNQLLRERALRLADERGGVTTDEETESKAGRYWSRTERRQQLQLAREQRLQALARGGAGPNDGGPRPTTVLELSHRKLSRLRNRKLLDDWTTVEELLTHGTRLSSRDGVRCPGSLLSVTTV